MNFLIAVLCSATIFVSGEWIAKLGSSSALALLWLALAAVGFVFKQKTDRKIGVADILWALLFCFFLASALFYMLPNQGNRRYVLNLTNAWLATGCSWLLFRRFLRTPQEIKSMLALVVALATALACYGMYRHFVETADILRAYKENPEQMLIAVGLNPAHTAARTLFESRLYTSTPIATYALTNTLAGLLAPAFVLAVGIGLTGRKPTQRLKPLATIFILAFVPAAAIGACLFLTESRSGLIAASFGVFLLLFGFFSKPRSAFIARCCCLLIFLTAAIVFLFHPTFGNQARQSLGFRLEYWTASCEMILDKPIFGCGAGNFQEAYQFYKKPYSAEEIADPHNFLFEIAAIAGLPSLFLFLGFVIAILKCKMGQFSRNSEAVGEQNFHIFGGCVGLILGFIISQGYDIEIQLFGLLFCVSVFAAVYFMLSRWIGHESQMPIYVISAALITLLTNLLASGGIMYPNIIIVFWLLAACIANSTEKGWKFGFSKSNRFHIVLSVLLTLLLIGSYFFVFHPVTQSKQLLADCDAASFLTRKIEKAKAAAKADPFSTEAKLKLFNLEVEHWRAEPQNMERKDAVLLTETELAKSSPKSATIFVLIGNQLIPIDMERALLRYQEACELYPNHVITRFPLVLALEHAGKHEEAQREAKIALELDDKMPHVEQKLPKEQREQLQRIGNILPI